MSKLIIIGAGLAGLTAGYHAQRKKIDYIIFEKDSSVGGLCKTKKKDGFYFDYSGHLLYFNNTYCQLFVKKMLGENLKSIKRNSFIYSNGIFTKYPFQANLYGLPPNILKECLLDFVKAYFEYEDLPTEYYKNFHEWILSKLGKGIGKHFMFPYNKKVWTVATEELTCEWLSRYVTKPSLEDVFNGAFFNQKKDFGYNAKFYYPKKGGIQALCDAVVQYVYNIKFEEELAHIDLARKEVKFKSGTLANYEYLISTMPLNKFLSKLIGRVPNMVKEAAQKLRHNSVLILNFGVKGNHLNDKHWVYLPEKKYTAYRVGVYSNISKFMAPPGTTSIYVEIAYQKDWFIDKKKVTEKAIDELEEIGFIARKEDILVSDIIDVECAYVIYDKNYSKSTRIIKDYLKSNNILIIGRYGNWEYSGMEEAILQGKSVIYKLF